LISKLREVGVPLEIEDNYITVSKGINYQAINIKTLVYPGFPTDLGQPFSVLLTQCEGTSFFDETIYENRMGHVSYLNKMGANIKSTNQSAKIIGPTALTSEVVTATDLRAGAAMVLAGLIAKGNTTILDAEHILRGYENIVDKLKNVGAKIEIAEIK
jgi:UDP-N-acetylglucosamine 1-carboxyvinyltransferase